MARQPVQEQYRRFSAAQRFEHIILLVSFAGLALTGLPQKFASEGWAQTLILWMGGIESVRIVHRFLAVLLMGEAIFHGGVISYKLFVLGQRATMLPGMKDLRDVRDWMLYNLGLKSIHPRLPRYNFGEKAEYLAVVWGTLLMIVTGFMMWNPIATAELLPGETIPAARVAHGGEAVLAVLSIITWHMYNVHFKRFNRSMFTGKLSRAAMEEEHAEELETLESGSEPPPLPSEVIARRRRRFWPYATVVTLILTIGLIWFITFEQTSISTVPRQDVVVFSPRVTPSAADPAVGAALWPTLRCANCHTSEEGVELVAPALLGTTLTFDEFYQEVRTGEGEMHAYVPGEIPDSYLLHLWAWLSEAATET